MLSKRFGVAGNPHTGYPDLTYSRITKLGWLRALVLDDSTWDAMLTAVPQSTNVAAVITGQSGPLANDFWSDGWRDTYTSYITRFCERSYKKVRLIEFANEWDFWDNEDKAEKAAELAILGTDICKRYGILGVLGSVASGDWTNQLARAIRVVDRAEKELGYKVIHGFAFHPYMSKVVRESSGAGSGTDEFSVPDNDWPRLGDKIRQAIDIAGGRAVAITEGGIKVGDAGGLRQQELYVHGFFQDELSKFTPDELLMATYFCWTDNNGSPGEQGNNGYGLLGENDRPRPAYNAATYQFQNEVAVDIPVSRLIADSYPAPEIPTEPPTPTPEPPTTPPVVVPPVQVPRTLSPSDAHSMRWRAIVPNAVYNSDFGFERHWRARENAWWGSPLTETESTLDDGRPVRVFANAVVAYNGDDTVEVLG